MSDWVNWLAGGAGLGLVAIAFRFARWFMQAYPSNVVLRDHRSFSEAQIKNLTSENTVLLAEVTSLRTETSELRTENLRLSGDLDVLKSENAILLSKLREFATLSAELENQPAPFGKPAEQATWVERQPKLPPRGKPE